MTNSYPLVGMLRLRSKVGSKGQAVIPKPVRDEMGIKPGDDVYFRVEGKGRIIVEARSPEEIVEEFLSAVPRRRLPAKIDWDKEHYSQFEDGHVDAE